MKSLEQILDENRVALPNWPSTETELDSFLSDVEECSLGIEDQDVRVANVLSRIEEAERAATHTQQGCQRLLFDDDSEKAGTSDAAEPYQSKLDFAGIVRDAYLEVFDGFSTDRVIADPDRNCLFVQACWKRGAQASQGELNRQLMNARKANRIGKIEGVQRYVVPRELMDSYLFASEVALRTIQDLEYHRQDRCVSLDDILCEPTLGRKFLEIAASISPGHQPVDYRWAALTIRKAFNRGSRKHAEKAIPEFELLGCRDRIRPSRIPKDAGFFWLKCGRVDFYIGHSQELRSQIEMLVESGFEERLANCQSSWLFEPEPASFLIASMPDRSATERDGIKRSLVDSFKPRVNVTSRGKRTVA